MRRLALLLPLVLILILIFLFWRHCGSHEETTACSTPCSASGQCTLYMPLPYLSEQAVLSASESLVLGEGASVAASGGAPGAIGNTGPVITAVGAHVKVGGVVSRASVSLGAGAIVNGPVTTGGELLNPAGAAVTGHVTTHAVVASDRHQAATVSFAASGPAVTVAGGATRNLAPGAYGDVRVDAGGTLALTTGTYQVASLAVLAGATLALNETAGPILIYAKETFEFRGTETQVGGDGHVLVAAFGCAPSAIAAPFRGTVSVQNASLSLAAPAGATFAGTYFASSLQLGANNSVQGLPPTWPTTPPPAGTPPARLPPKLPPPPAPVVGCYVNTKSGWKSTPCAADAFIRSNFPRPDAQFTMSDSATPRLVYGQLAVTVPAVASEANGFVSSTCAISPLCVCSGTPVANQWSVQSNTNQWTIPSTATSGAGDTAAVQFVIQSNGSTSAICIWNVDVTAQSYPNTCVTAQQRSGGMQPFDEGNISATVNSNGTLSMVARLSWVPNGQPNEYAVVTNDIHSLSGNWTQVSGGIIGIGSCSQAQFTTAELFTQAVASTCSGDTDGTSPTCAPPVLQPNASASVGNTGTVETNNLTAVGSPSVSFPNSDLVVTNLRATTTGSCLGPSHAYVRDNDVDYGATPSNLGTQVFWESPDLFLVPRGTPIDPTSVSTESILTPGGLYDVWVRVHNDLGCNDVTGVKALVYLADPSALSVQWTPITGGNYVGPNGGSTGVTAPTGGVALIGPLPFTAPSSGLGNGHKCILAAVEADGEGPPANTSDAPDSNQVAQRNVQFVGPCEYPLTNGTAQNGNVALTLSMTPTTGAAPSLTALPDVEVKFDDSDSSWFNVWNSQPGAGSTFAVTHSGSSTTVRLGAFSVALNSVPLAAGQTRSATGTSNLPSGYGSITLQVAATLSETGGSGAVMVANGGSCVMNAPVIIK